MDEITGRNWKVLVGDVRDGTVPARKTRNVKHTAHQLKDVLRCNKCSARWNRARNTMSEPCPQCQHVTDSRKGRASGTGIANLAEWKAKNGDRLKGLAKARRDKFRLDVLRAVGRGTLTCVRCGCDRSELLELNHIHGGGTAEYKRTGQIQMCRDILALRRTTDDLELCCRVCNALHFLELKYGPLPYSITFTAASAQTGEACNG